jgi:hypothetical protein
MRKKLKFPLWIADSTKNSVTPQIFGIRILLQVIRILSCEQLAEKTVVDATINSVKQEIRSGAPALYLDGERGSRIVTSLTQILMRPLQKRPSAAL